MATPDPVLATDASFLYLSKTAGVPVFAPHDGSGGASLYAATLDSHPEQQSPSDADEWPAGFAAGIVHRLDTWTSGLVIAARSLEALAAARAAFAEHRLSKGYFFLSDRDVSWDEHRVDHDLAHDRRKRSRMTWKRGQATPHRGQWYQAETRLRRAEQGGGGYRLWQATMATGVMHQIRVHAASVGIPLLGDKRYGGGAPMPGSAAEFFLHHEGLMGPDLRPPKIPVPDFWPAPR